MIVAPIAHSCLCHCLQLHQVQLIVAFRLMLSVKFISMTVEKLVMAHGYCSTTPSFTINVSPALNQRQTASRMSCRMKLIKYGIDSSATVTVG